MRLRRNQLCPIHRSQSCCGRETIPQEKRQRQLGIRRIDDLQHPRGYREFARMGKCESCWTRRLWRRKANAASAMRSSPTTATLCPTTSIPVVWEERGETTIRTTSRLSTGGATGKRGRAEGDVGAVRNRSLIRQCLSECLKTGLN